MNSYRGSACPKPCGYPAVDEFMIVRVDDGVPSDATSIRICQECGSTRGPDGDQPRLNFD